MAERGNLVNYSTQQENKWKTLSIEWFRKMVKDSWLSPNQVYESAKAQWIQIEWSEWAEKLWNQVNYNQQKLYAQKLQARKENIPWRQKWAVRNIANPLRKKLDKEIIDPNMPLEEIWGKSFKTVAFEDMWFAPDVIWGAAQSVISAPTDIVWSLVWLFNKEKWQNIAKAWDITPFLEKNGLADTWFFDVSKMATDLGISMAATTWILKWLNSVWAVKSFWTQYPWRTKWLTQPIAEWVVGTQLTSAVTEWEAASVVETGLWVWIWLALNWLVQWYMALKPGKITPQKAAAQITWSSNKVWPDDIDKIINAIKDQALNTDDVLTYADLDSNISKAKWAIYDAQKSYLQSFKNTYAVDDLIVKVTEWSTEVDENFVLRSLDEMSELAEKWHSITNSKILLSKVNTRRDKLSKWLLSLDDINDISIDYSKNFKWFSDATGRPLTSVWAKQAEQTRRWVKNTLRWLLPDDTSRLLDGRYANMSKLWDAVADMKKRVFNLWKKTTGSTFGDSLAWAMDELDLKVTWGTAWAIRRKFGIPSGRGNKVLNSLWFEEVLAKNIQIVEAMDAVLDGSKNKSAIVNTIKEIMREFSMSAEDMADWIRIFTSAQTADFLADNW